MTDLNQTCLYCSRLAMCQHLGDSRGAFSGEKVVTFENAGVCSDWHPVNHVQVESREETTERAGEINTLRTLYELPDIVFNELREGEKLAEMMEEIPNFAAMRWEGMTVSQRKEQLEYQTDDDGNILIETDKEGNEFPLKRPSYQLKGWATLSEEEGGEVHLPLKTAWSCIIETLIRHIIDFELQAGLIVKDKKTKGKATEPAKPQERETPTMATTKGRQVRVARGAAAKPAAKPKTATAKPRTAAKPAGKPAPGGRVARPPRKPGAPASIPQEAPEETAGGFNMGEMQEMIKMTVRAEVAAQTKELMVSFEMLLKAITISYDMAVQTGGQYAFPQEDDQGNLVVDEDGNLIMDQLPELFAKESKILAFTDGTAYDEEVPAEDPGEG